MSLDVLRKLANYADATRWDYFVLGYEGFFTKEKAFKLAKTPRAKAAQKAVQQFCNMHISKAEGKLATLFGHPVFKVKSK